MTTPDTSTTTTCIRWLAEQEKPCDGWVCTHNREAMKAGLPSIDPLDACQGTGRVAMFPLLRVACKYKGVTNLWTDGRGLTWEALRRMEKSHEENRCGCGGRGWAPLPESECHLETVIDIISAASYHYSIKRHSVEIWIPRSSVTTTTGTTNWMEDIDTPGAALTVIVGHDTTLALLRALVAAVKARGG